MRRAALDMKAGATRGYVCSSFYEGCWDHSIGGAQAHMWRGGESRREKHGRNIVAPVAPTSSANRTSSHVHTHTRVPRQSPETSAEPLSEEATTPQCSAHACAYLQHMLSGQVRSWFWLPQSVMQGVMGRASAMGESKAVIPQTSNPNPLSPMLIATIPSNIVPPKQKEGHSNRSSCCLATNEARSRTEVPR